MNATPENTATGPEQVIADLQRQLAECQVDCDEALQRETAIAEVLQVINASPGDLAPVFDAMLEKALRLCGAAFGALFIRDGDRFRAVATRNLSPTLQGLLQQPFAPSSTGFFAQAARGQDFEHIVDGPLLPSAYQPVMESQLPSSCSPASSFC